MPLLGLKDVASAAVGAGLESAFSGLLEAVYVVIKQNVKFNPVMKSLAERLESLRPEIKRIEAADGELDRPKKIEGLKKLLESGTVLVNKCSKVSKYNFVMKPVYLQKLQKLDAKLSKYITNDLQLQLRADQAETLVEVRQQGDFGRRTYDIVNTMSKQLGQMSMSARYTGSGGFSMASSLVAFVGGCSPPELKVCPVGLEIPMRELKRKMLKEEFPLLILSAPGGCGKTTLATAFCQDPDVKGRFDDNIFYLTVTKEPDLEAMVQRLFQHKGFGIPSFLGEEDMLHQLENMVKQIGVTYPILLVLDDVWSESEDLLDKLNFRIKNYQILVTSRYEFPRFGATYELQTLNEEDAMNLFRQSAFLPNSNSHAPDQNAMNEIVKSCKGFPLAISVIGKSLCGKSAAEWRETAKKCSTSILSNYEKELLRRLQISVDALDCEVKECFMDLGSFPEDQRIPASALVDIWVGSHDLEKDSAVANLHKLSNLSLIDLVVTRKDRSEEDGFYNEQYVKQHDLLRELAIIQSNPGTFEQRKRLFLHVQGNKLPDWWIQPQYISANLLAISTDKRFTSSWCSMQAPGVKVLVLNFQSEDYALPEFVKTMENLKILIVTNHGLFPVELRNFAQASSSNLKRIRLEKVSIPSNFMTSIQMNQLEKISLVMCNIGQAFSNIDIQISDRLPNLLEVDIDYCNDLEELPSSFCDLLQLKKLSITNCHKLTALSEDIGKLRNLETLRLNSCIELPELPKMIGSLCELRILDLSDCLSLKILPEQIGELSNLRKLYMIDCLSCKLPTSVTKLSQPLEIVGDEETADSWSHYKRFLPDLTVKVHKDINLNWLH